MLGILLYSVKVVNTSTPTPEAKQTNRVFFGWYIVGFTFVSQFVAMGTTFYAFGVLLKPLTEALDADRFTVSLALSLQMAISALVSPKIGKLISDRPIRQLMATGAILMSVAFLGMSQAQSFWQLCIVYGLLGGVAMAMIGPLPNNTILANWFFQRRGMALGISQFGVSISGTVMVPVTAFLVLEYGWRTAAGVFAFIPLLILLPLILKFAIRTPEEMGLHQDGAHSPPHDVEEEETEDWTMGRALRDPRIWKLVAVLGPSFLSVGAVLVAMHSHATDTGLTAIEASSVVALITLFGAIAKPLFGTLSDFFNQRLVMAIAVVSQVTGLILIVTAGGYAGLMIAAVFFGLGYGAGLPMWSVLIVAMFGRKSFAKIMGVMSPMTMPFSLIGLPFATYIFELTGSYVPAFTTLIGLFAISLLALAFLRLPSERSAAA